MREGKDVICPGCGNSYHVTTTWYNASKPANGKMCTLKEPWKSYGWSTYGDGPTALGPDQGEREDIPWSLMECPNCCNPLAPNGKLKIRKPLTPIEKRTERILVLRGMGWSYAKIGKAVDLSATQVSRIVKENINDIRA